MVRLFTFLLLTLSGVVLAPADPLHVEQVHVREFCLVHSISPAIAVLLHGSATTNKSFMCQFSTEFVTKPQHAPSSIADGDTFMVEASNKGIRLGIINHDRVSASTVEVANNFTAPWGDRKQANAHVNYFTA